MQQQHPVAIARDLVLTDGGDRVLTGVGMRPGRGVRVTQITRDISRDAVIGRIPRAPGPQLPMRLATRGGTVAPPGPAVAP